MKVLMCYDVSDSKRRRKLVKFLEKYGVRIQFSVFIGDVSDNQLKIINNVAEKILDNETDKFYVYKNSDSCGFQKIDPLPKKLMII